MNREAGKMTFGVAPLEAGPTKTQSPYECLRISEFSNRGSDSRSFCIATKQQ
jgi:hypothetical protein